MIFCQTDNFKKEMSINKIFKNNSKLLKNNNRGFSRKELQKVNKVVYFKNPGLCLITSSTMR